MVCTNKIMYTRLVILSASLLVFTTIADDGKVSNLKISNDSSTWENGKSYPAHKSIMEYFKNEYLGKNGNLFAIANMANFVNDHDVCAKLCTKDEQCSGKCSKCKPFSLFAPFWFCGEPSNQKTGKEYNNVYSKARNFNPQVGPMENSAGSFKTFLNEKIPRVSKEVPIENNGMVRNGN